LNSVSKTYRGKVVLEDFSLVVEAGERVVILGPSGCGKTTVLRLLAGFIAPDSGSVSIAGQQAAAEGKIIQPPERRNVGMVFQDLALWPHLTVEGNLEFGLKAQHVAKSERQRRMTEMLVLVQMEAYRHARPPDLSGGQQQRIALARALILQPKVLLMDEALSSLDEELNLHLRKELLLLHDQLGFTLIYVTHDHVEAHDLGTRIVCMRKGRIERIGTASEVMRGGARHAGEE
jgi:ABC-type Fe3+/spermidine/putrescine transport system ATPase subunit